MTEYIAVIKDEIAQGAEHRYLRLPHPRTGEPQLYLPYDAPSGSGICEVVKVSGARGRTWFIGDDKLAPGSMLVHHPIDAFFLAAPVALSLIPSDGRAHFQTLSDLLSTASSSDSFALRPAFSPSTGKALYNPDVERLARLKPFKKAFRACCERKVVDAAPPSPPADGEETEKPKPVVYYRPSRDAVLTVLKAKVAHLADEKRFALFDHLVRSLAKDGLLEPGVDKKLVQSARNHGAVDQIAAYLPATLLVDLKKSYDFTALDAYQSSRAAAAMAAQMPVVPSDKKSGAGTKRKVVAQPTSRGVEALKKVKTGGMAKMTSFFKPKEKEKN